jgi:hypothetical protein
MAEFATYNDRRIQIGTCENLYGLRADQAHLVSPAIDGHAIPWRFRFQFPDEDEIEPGAFADANRSVAVVGLAPPAALAAQHNKVRFTAEQGYDATLPCPESGPPPAGVRVARHGSGTAVHLWQQTWRNGALATVLRCNACAVTWTLETVNDAQALIQAMAALAEAERDLRPEWWAKALSRVRDGYLNPRREP